jgi:hypothetical protein
MIYSAECTNISSKPLKRTGNTHTLRLRVDSDCNTDEILEAKENGLIALVVKGQRVPAGVAKTGGASLETKGVTVFVQMSEMQSRGLTSDDFWTPGLKLEYDLQKALFNMADPFAKPIKAQSSSEPEGEKVKSESAKPAKKSGESSGKRSGGAGARA